MGERPQIHTATIPGGTIGSLKQLKSHPKFKKHQPKTPTTTPTRAETGRERVL